MLAVTLPLTLTLPNRNPQNLPVGCIEARAGVWAYERSGPVRACRRSPYNSTSARGVLAGVEFIAESSA